MPKSVYIHIPFCKSKCKYCSFVSFPNLDLIPIYINNLIQEITSTYSGEKIKTLYLGGGTPSLLNLKTIESLIRIFNFDSEYELTIELNPDDINYNYLYGLKTLGVNRLSIGSQTFNDKILNFIGRRHDSKNILKTIELAKKCDFNNLSLDLIYGLPYQDINSLKFDLKEFLKLDIQHISTYGLKVEDNSYWGKFFDNENYQLKFQNSTINIPDNDIQAEMYELINEILSKNDFYRYEISNFAKKGFESKHNLNYWNNDEYYGFGIAAHGYINGFRYSNYENFSDYVKNINKKNFSHKVTKTEKIEEEIFLGLRKTEGINILNFNKKFGIDFYDKYENVLSKYSDFIHKTPSNVSLNLKGVLLSNIIISEFL